MLRCARDTEPETIEKALKKELRRSGMVLEDPAVLQAMRSTARSNRRATCPSR